MKRLLAAYILVYATNTKAEINRADFKCLAQAIHQEARGEPLSGKYAVGQVIINRTKLPYYPSTICAVIYQPGQFQWTKKNKNVLPDIASYKIARNVILGTHPYTKFSGTHFHATYVRPGWKHKKIALIGKHIFYREKSNQT